MPLINEKESIYENLYYFKVYLLPDLCSMFKKTCPWKPQRDPEDSRTQGNPWHHSIHLTLLFCNGQLYFHMT